MTDDKNQERIAQVRARLSAATPGPWHAPSLADGVRHLERNCSEWYGAELPEGFTVPGRQNGDGGQRDGEFIANAPTDIAFLLSRVDSLESALREAQKDVERLDYIQARRSAGHSVVFSRSLAALQTAAQHTNTWDRNGNIREAIDAAKASR